jgi:hypothetical protein
MSFISYSSSSFITIEDDEDCICSMRRSIAISRSKEIWNVSCIFIDWDKSSWQASLIIFFILYDSIHLWFSFFDDRSVLMFFVDNHIMSSTSYSDESVLFWSTYRFWFFCAFANFFLMKFQISVILLMIFDALRVNIRSFADL